MNEIEKLAPEELVKEVFENTNFGGTPPRKVIANTLLKIASGYSTGSTAIAICKELNLLESVKKLGGVKLTVKGGYYLYEVFKDKLKEG